MRERYGIGAYEAEHILPLWERNMMLRWFYNDENGSPQGDPFDHAPEGLNSIG